MTQTFVRFTPAVERPEPTFEQNMQTILATTLRYIEGSVKAEGIGRAAVRRIFRSASRSYH